MIKRNSHALTGNEKGIVLLVTLLIIALLVLLGSIAVQYTTTDLKIAGNQKLGATAFYAAEAGIAEAMERLRGAASAANYAGDPATTPDVLWSAYILASNTWQTSDDPQYNTGYRNYIPTSASHTNTSITVNSLQSAIPYMVKIRHKTEYDAELAGHTSVSSPHYYDNDGNTGMHATAASPGKIICWGYGNSATPATATQFTSSAVTEFKPVEIITGFAREGNAVKRIRAEVVRNPGPLVQAAIYAKGDITGNGTAMVVDGSDHCGAAPSKPPTYTLNPSVTNPHGSPPLIPAPPGPQQGSLDIDIAGYVTDLKNSATVSITSDTNGAAYGNSTNYVTAYSNTSNPYNVQGLKLQNVVGYGILLVDGDLELGGGFVWNGLVLCTGVLTFNGGGAGVNIRGAVLANQTVAINGGLDIGYDSCAVENALANQAMRVISWQEEY